MGFGFHAASPLVVNSSNLTLNRTSLNLSFKPPMVHFLRPKGLGNLLGVAAMVCLSLVSGEYAARFLFRDVTTTSHDSYFTKRWERKVVKNSWGFRERQFDVDKATGIY